jgi:hypothetical protein
VRDMASCKQVKAQLAQNPPSLDVHKSIAKKLGIKERLAYLAIGQITKAGEKLNSAVDHSASLQKEHDEP